MTKEEFMKATDAQSFIVFYEGLHLKLASIKKLLGEIGASKEIESEFEGLLEDIKTMRQFMEFQKKILKRTLQNFMKASGLTTIEQKIIIEYYLNGTDLKTLTRKLSLKSELQVKKIMDAAEKKLTG